MSEHYRHRLHQLQSLLEPGLRRMLLISFLLHLIVPVILSGVLKVTHKTPQLPVYRVNLVNMPVKNPRAGRPDAAPSKRKEKPRVIDKAEAVKIPARTVKKVPVKKATPTPKAAPVAKAVKPDTAAADALQKRLAEMQAKAERQQTLDKLKAVLAAQKAALEKPDIKAPVGEPDGTGNEIGVKATRYVENFIKEQWRLSKYQLPNLDLEVEAKLFYSKAGMLGVWEIVTPSGNAFFDESVKKAILRSKNLGRPLPAADTFDIVFNLKDLQTQ
ncbi:TonB C-terminal domain-containing protein [Geopsychrobacter electrodiphilus]|uniref:TonB C-terminal domain-containing protein n=1 Tax=Geopsychrobacter electrodiphilus TaxID=225196 RepID=UPI00036476B5|nr:TonB C-terminal domain-containing protein [Geopsychrobacter electrodiphilus]